MPDHKNVEMLLIEDEASDVELILRTLKKKDWAGRIHVVRDGAEALDFIFCAGVYSGRDIQNPLKVILLDLKLPKMNGHEVLRAIKSDERTRAIPVVIMSSSEREEDMAECNNLGASSYIVKMIDPEKFSNAIEQFSQRWLLNDK